MRWISMTENPIKPCSAVLLCDNLVFRSHGDVQLPGYREERAELGFWDGERWYEMGTGHAINERLDYMPERMPTRYAVLPDR